MSEAQADEPFDLLTLWDGNPFTICFHETPFLFDSNDLPTVEVGQGVYATTYNEIVNSNWAILDSGAVHPTLGPWVAHWESNTLHVSRKRN